MDSADPLETKCRLFELYINQPMQAHFDIISSSKHLSDSLSPVSTHSSYAPTNISAVGSIHLRDHDASKVHEFTVPVLDDLPDVARSGLR